MATRIDWFRVLADLKEHGLSLYAVSEETGIPQKTLDDYRNRDAEPRHCDGEVLLALWARVMRPALPRTQDMRRNKRESARRGVGQSVPSRG